MERSGGHLALILTPGHKVVAGTAVVSRRLRRQLVGLTQRGGGGRRWGRLAGRRWRKSDRSEVKGSGPGFVPCEANIVTKDCNRWDHLLTGVDFLLKKNQKTENSRSTGRAQHLRRHSKGWSRRQRRHGLRSNINRWKSWWLAGHRS